MANPPNPTPGIRYGGRQKNTPNKATVEKFARAKSIMDMAREGGKAPVEVLFDSMRAKWALAAKYQSDNLAELQKGNAAIVDRFAELLKRAEEPALELMEYTHAKLHRIHHVGEAPKLVENKMIVELRIGGDPRDGLIIEGAADVRRPLSVDGGNGAGAGAGNGAGGNGAGAGAGERDPN